MAASIPDVDERSSNQREGGKKHTASGIVLLRRKDRFVWKKRDFTECELGAGWYKLGYIPRRSLTSYLPT